MVSWPWLCLLMLPRPEAPSLCVSFDTAGHGRVTHALDLDELVLDLRARVGESSLAVERCDETGKESWRVTLWAPDAEVLDVQIEDSAFSWRRPIAIGKRSPRETAQLVALHVTEAVRP